MNKDTLDQCRYSSGNRPRQRRSLFTKTLRWKAGNRAPGHLGYWNPHGVTPSDTVLPDGSKIEASPHTLIEHFMDPYGIDYDILNPAGLFHIGNHPDADYAAAVCEASNRVVEEEWIASHPRLRSSITVSPQNPLPEN